MDKQIELDVTTWFSTYGLLTSSRILEQLKIHLTQDELLPAIKQASSVYHQLLAIPIKNVLNGIIYQQAYDYQVYAQKLLVDYLLSGEHNKDPESPGAGTREQLAQLREKLAQVNDSFSQKQEEHENLISQSQASLIRSAAELQNILRVTASKIKLLFPDKSEESILLALRSLMIYFKELDYRAITSEANILNKLSTSLQVSLNEKTKHSLADILDALNDSKSDIDNIILSFGDQTEEIGLSFRNFRSQFYNLILNITESLNMLPDYQVNEAQEKTNRESLYFDASLGDYLGKEVETK